MPTTPFEVAKSMIRSGLSGGWFLLGLCRKMWPDQSAEYCLTNGVRVSFPLKAGWEKYWLEKDACFYESDLVRQLSLAIDSRPDVTLIDCGADVGIFSAVVCSCCPNITRVVAFEPNPSAYPFLHRTICQLPRGEAHQAAISDFSGFGGLASLLLTVHVLMHDT